MSLDTLFHGILRDSGGQKRAAEVTARGALYVASDLPSYVELVNKGVCWEVGELTAVAAVTAVPTTTAQISLYNDNPEGGSSMAVFEVYGIQVGNGAAQASWAILGCIQDVIPATRPTQDIAKSSVKGLKSRQGAYGGGAIIDLNNTVTDDLWKALGDSVNTAVVSLSGTQKDVGLVVPRILPPGGMMSLTAVASATGITTRLGFRFAELLLP